MTVVCPKVLLASAWTTYAPGAKLVTGMDHVVAAVVTIGAVTDALVVLLKIWAVTVACPAFLESLPVSEKLFVVTFPFAAGNVNEIPPGKVLGMKVAVSCIPLGIVNVFVGLIEVVVPSDQLTNNAPFFGVALIV